MELLRTYSTLGKNSHQRAEKEGKTKEMRNELFCMIYSLPSSNLILTLKKWIIKQDTVQVFFYSVLYNCCWQYIKKSNLLCPWGFSRQEYWSGLPYPPPGDPPNQEIPRSPAMQADSLILYWLSHPRRPGILEWVAYILSKGYSWPRNQTGVSCIAGRFFFTSWATREASFISPILII